MPYITYDEGDGEIKSVRLRQDAKIRIGRGEENEIRMATNPKASRNHCVIEYSAPLAAYIVRDLGSTNGTLRNGIMVSSDTPLAEGDEVSIGGIRMRFHGGEEVLAQTRGVKTAEPVKAFGLEDLTALERTQSIMLSSTDSGAIDKSGSTPQFSIHYELPYREGDFIGENRILRKTYESQFSCMYLVKIPDDAESQEGVLKIFKKTMEEGKATEEFLACIQEAGKIHDPGFVKYIEAGIHENHCYFVTEHLENLNLAKRISLKAPFHENDCLEIVREIAANLSFALSAFNTFHRNLKPSNILYRKDEALTITDYGLASWVSVYIAGGVSIASPWYISPEQIKGTRVTWSCDLYSLGIMLFQMLTGVLPFHSTVEEELLGMHIQTPFPAPTDRNPNVKISQETCEILKVMTAKAPEERYESWTAFIQAVEHSMKSLSGIITEKVEEQKAPPSTAPIAPAPAVGTAKRAKLIFAKPKPRTAK